MATCTSIRYQHQFKMLISFGIIHYWSKRKANQYDTSGNTQLALWPYKNLFKETFKLNFYICLKIQYALGFILF